MKLKVKEPLGKIPLFLKIIKKFPSFNSHKPTQCNQRKICNSSFYFYFLLTLLSSEQPLEPKQHTNSISVCFDSVFIGAKVNCKLYCQNKGGGGNYEGRCLAKVQVASVISCFERV